jgi:ribose transport system permease protein
MRRHETVLIAYAVLLAAVVAGSVATPILLSGPNMGNLLEQTTALGIAAIGQTLVILTAGIDLSVGSVISLTVALLSVLMEGGRMAILPSLLIAMAVGALIGAINGIGITKFKIPPFVMTLGMMSVAAGTALKIRPLPGGEIAYQLSDFLNYRIGIIPVATMIFALLLAVCYFMLTRTKFGRNIYATGGNERTSALSGIRTDRVKLAVYTLSGLAASLAGIYVASRMGTGDATVGKYFTLDTVTVAVLGGINLFGGRGSLIGIIASLFVLTTLNNILNLTGVDSFYQYVLKGLILLLVVSFYALRGRRGNAASL